MSLTRVVLPVGKFQHFDMSPLLSKMVPCINISYLSSHKSLQVLGRGLRTLCHSPKVLPRSQPFSSLLSMELSGQTTLLPRRIHNSSNPLFTAAKADDATKDAKPVTGAEGRLKKAIAEYGKAVLVLYVSVGLVNLSIVYLALYSGLDVVGFLSKLPVVGEKIAANQATAGASTLVIAYCIHKLMAPIRISATLGLTPFFVKALKSRGMVK